MVAETGPAVRQSKRFLALYAAAFSGGAIAYVPLITLLLPLRAEAVAGPDAVNLLAQAAFAGALAASLGNIAFGWLSDLTGSRHGWIWAGMVLSCALLLLVPQVHSAGSLVALVIVWQLCLNMMLAPLTAMAGDWVPDEQKGLLGGLMAAAPASGALAGMVITLPGLAEPAVRHVLVAGFVVLTVAPLLLAGQPIAMPQLDARTAPPEPGRSGSQPAGLMWLARLLVQIAEASLFAFLLLWLRSLEPGFGDHDAARIFTVVLAGAMVCAVMVGRWSDRLNRPILPLALSAAIAALGLGIMARAGDMTVALAGYVFFGLSSSVFLALHSSQTLRVLPNPRRRGRDLGIFNLTNTAPSLIMPWLTLALVPDYGFAVLFVVLAALVGLACAILLLLALRLERAG